MRRFLLLMGLLLILFSCSTGPDVADQADDAVDAPAMEPDAPPDPPEEDAPTPQPKDEPTDVEPEPDAEPEPEPEAPPQPLTLQLINPSDPARVTRTSFLLSAVASEGTLAAFEIEMLSGPFVPRPDQDPFGVREIAAFDQQQRRYVVPVMNDPMLVRLPPGFVDGASYELRLRGILEDERATEWVTLSPVLDLGIAPPRVDVPPPTIDATPTIAVTGDEPVQVIVNGDSAFVATAGGELEFPFELTAGTYRVQARALSDEGYLSRSSIAQILRVRADAQPAVKWPAAGEATLTPRVGLRWTPVEGGVAYQARFRPAEDEAWQLLNPTAASFVAVPDPLAPGASYEWQVRTQNEAGNWFSWSPETDFTVGSFGLDFATIIRSGQHAILTRGYADGSRDERPVREITLTGAYEMALTPLSNAELVTLIAYAGERGMVEIDEIGVWSVEEDRRALVGLGDMDYGRQFGLAYRDGAVVARPDYAEHPAVGVTWLGAVYIANLLSYVEGRALAYDESGAPTGADRAYRLPTEAEWEFAARGTTGRLVPWGGSLSGRVSNYYRSFDPFEDVNEPFTGNGGPTTPVGFFDGSARDGFQTASDASPFGIRDMVGNVWEWCFDRYDPGYYAQSPDADPQGPDESEIDTGGAIVLAVALDPNQRVVRGSAWNSRSPDVRLTNRGRYSELGRSYSIGVRLVRGLGSPN